MGPYRQSSKVQVVNYVRPMWRKFFRWIWITCWVNLLVSKNGSMRYRRRRPDRARHGLSAIDGG